MSVMPPNRDSNRDDATPCPEPVSDRPTIYRHVRPAGIVVIVIVCLLAGYLWFAGRQPEGASSPAASLGSSLNTAVSDTVDADGLRVVVSTRRGLELRNPRLYSNNILFISVNSDRSKLEPLENFHQLRHLAIVGSLPKKPQISLLPVGQCTHIKKLLLEELEIDSLVPLAQLNGLNRLILLRCTVLDWQSLRFLSRPRWLELTGSNIAELSCLSGLKEPEQLWLPSTRVTDLRPLYGHPTLRFLTIDKRRYSRDGISALLESIPGLKVTDTRENE